MSEEIPPNVASNIIKRTIKQPPRPLKRVAPPSLTLAIVEEEPKTISSEIASCGGGAASPEVSSIPSVPAHSGAGAGADDPIHDSEPSSIEIIKQGDATPVSVPKDEAETDAMATAHAKVDMDSIITISDELRSRLSSNFAKCVKGYHLVNDDPIKETPWEDINAIILNASGCDVHSQSNGSHKSGGDLSSSLGTFSDKSTQYGAGNESFKISSYRLTTVCSDKTPGKIEDIIAEINNRKNFNYYSIIVREDTETQILYEWYLIPSDFPALNPASYKWQPKLGKTGKNKGATTGWETDLLSGSSMSITFSMSSQLWIDVNITDEMKKFIVGSCRVNRGRKYNYIQLYEKDCSAV